LRLRVSKVSVVLFAAALTAASFSACGWWRAADEKAAEDADFSEFSTNIPFSTGEPETFQAGIVVTTVLNGTKSERKYFAAKKGGNSLTTFNAGAPDARTRLQTADGKVFIIANGTKTFTEIPPGSAGDDDFELSRFLTTKWLNEQTGAGFQKLGTENNLTKYLVRPISGQNTEILIYVDENLKIPVRQEFYSLSGEEKVLTSAVEIRDFKAEAEDKLFELPGGFERVE
jgi:outer membrane lipoprotein-sorting protein